MYAELPYGWQRSTTENGTPYYIKLVTIVQNLAKYMYMWLMKLIVQNFCIIQPEMILSVVKPILHVQPLNMPCHILKSNCIKFVYV